MQTRNIINYVVHPPLIKRLAIVGAVIFALCACNGERAAPGDVVEAGEAPIKPETGTRRPNLLIIMADDLGYSDIGSFGGEIETPNLDTLAQSGVQMVNFYASLTCSPSRAMLMAGADNHLAGLGNMDETLADNQIGLPGYEGYLNERVLSLAEALKFGGYKTYMAGKWHLGLKKEQGPAERGFDQSFALLIGGASHYDNSFGPDEHRTTALYRDNGKLLTKAPEGFFSSAFYTNRIIDNIDSGIESGEEEPFFAYLSFTAPHWPLQFPPDYTGKYSDTYKVGWQQIRQQRIARQKSLGLVTEISDLAPLDENWESLSDSEQLMRARQMEIYASMVDDMDANIGRLISHLKSKGLYENTVIVFLSDNGASTWGEDTAPPVVGNWAKTFNNSYDNAGQPDSYILYGKTWGNVSNTPFKHGKGNASEGGIRVPMIVRMPVNPQADTSPRRISALAGIEDIMPTMLEMAGVDGEIFGQSENRVPVTGTSFLSALLDDPDTASERMYVGREIWGKRGLRAGQWKLVNQPPPTGTGEWQLYNLENDLAEQHDLAATQPQKLAEMRGLWQSYVKHNNVVLPEGKFRVRDTGPLPTE